jgi:hypothetical protein
MGDEDELPGVYTTYNFELKLIRCLENMLVPTTLKVAAEFIAIEDADEDDIDFAFTKIRYWLDYVVSKSVVFSHDNSSAIEMFIDESTNSRLGNVMVLTPEEPDDQHLAAILQAKLTALAGGSLIFGPMELTSDNIVGLTFTFIGDSSAVLPSNEEWAGTRTYFDEPWWNRDDGSTLDVLPPEDADLSIKPSWAFNFDFLKKNRQNPTKAGMIVRPEFKPTVITGGKTEDKDD